VFLLEGAFFLFSRFNSILRFLPCFFLCFLLGFVFGEHVSVSFAGRGVGGVFDKLEMDLPLEDPGAVDLQKACCG